MSKETLTDAHIFKETEEKQKTIWKIFHDNKFDALIKMGCSTTDILRQNKKWNGKKKSNSLGPE